MPAISEDDLETFEGWLRFQGFDTATPDQLLMLRAHFEQLRAKSLATPKIGRRKFRNAGEYAYAVAIRKSADLWITLLVKRNKKGEFFVFVSRADPEFQNHHVSYHLDGTLHSKSFGGKRVIKKLQPLTGRFTGIVHLGAHMGHGTSNGAICDSADLSGVVEVSAGVLGPMNGAVLVDLIEPGQTPLPDHRPIVQEHAFRDFLPWVVIRIAE